MAEVECNLGSAEKPWWGFCPHPDTCRRPKRRRLPRLFRWLKKVWDAAMTRARQIVNQRTLTYESRSDLLAETNPYRREPE